MSPSLVARLRSHPSLIAGLLAFLGAAACTPEIKSLSPADGTITGAATTVISGTYGGVDAANAVVTVNGAPATLGSGKSFSFDADLDPGANTFLVQLGDTTKPDVRVRKRIVVIRGDSIAASESAASAVGLRLNESFVGALPMEAIVEAALAPFVADNEFYQQGLGAQLIEDLIASAGSLEVEIDEADGLRLTITADIEVDGEFPYEGPFGTDTCAATGTITGTVGVEGRLAPDPDDPAGLVFDGEPVGGLDPDLDVHDPSGLGICDLAGAEVPIGPVLDHFVVNALPELARKAADAIRLEAEVHACAAGPCPPGTEIDLGFEGSFEAVDELDGGIVAEAALRVEPTTAAGVRSFAVDSTLPSLDATTPRTGRSYDLGLAITPTAVNQLLMALTAEGALAYELPQAQVDALMALFGGGFTGLSGRISVSTAPFLDGSVVCPGNLGIPRLVLPNARFEVRGTPPAGGAEKVVLSAAIDLVAGIRLAPTYGEDGLALGPDLVLGAACAETSFVPTVLHNETTTSDGTVQAWMSVFPDLGLSAALALPALPLGELVTLEDGDGEELATVGLQIVEVANEGSAFQVFANVVADGEGDDPNVVVLDEIFNTSVDHGELVGMEMIDGKLYLGFGEFGPASTIYRFDPALPFLGLQLVTDQVFTPPGTARGIASDGTHLYAIGVPGDYFEDGTREIRRITTTGEVSTVTSWPWDNQFASSIYAEPGYVYYQRAYNPNVTEWNTTEGRAIWRVGTDGSNPERWVGQQGSYLEITADIYKLGGDFLGAGYWIGDWLWSEWYRFPDERELSPGDAVQLGWADAFTAREMTTACGGYVLLAGEQGPMGALWSSRQHEGPGKELAIAYPPVAPLAGIVRDGQTIYLAAGNPGRGVQIYTLSWPCPG